MENYWIFFKKSDKNFFNIKNKNLTSIWERTWKHIEFIKKKLWLNKQRYIGESYLVKVKEKQTIPIYNFQNKKDETQIFALFLTSNIEAFKNEDLSSLRRIYKYFERRSITETCWKRRFFNYIVILRRFWKYYFFWAYFFLN